jgi:hypothetical protein
MAVLLDSLLMGGIRFVLDKIASAVESEMNDEGSLKEELLAAQMRLELGEIDDDEFVDIEREVMARLREIRAARGEGGAAIGVPRDGVSGVEVRVETSFDAPDIPDIPDIPDARGRR